MILMNFQVNFTVVSWWPSCPNCNQVLLPPLLTPLSVFLQPLPLYTSYQDYPILIFTAISGTQNHGKRMLNHPPPDKDTQCFRSSITTTTTSTIYLPTCLPPCLHQKNQLQLPASKGPARQCVECVRSPPSRSAHPLVSS